MSNVYSNRWTINSSELIAGHDDAIKYYQDSIINSYNHHMVHNNLNFKLQEFHGPLLRIEPKTHYIKGKANIIIEFTDPCDRVSKLAFYESHDPFALHDFEKEIPNPKTREHAASNISYQKCTLKDHGLHRLAKKL